MKYLAIISKQNLIFFFITKKIRYLDIFWLLHYTESFQTSGAGMQNRICTVPALMSFTDATAHLKLNLCGAYLPSEKL